MDVDKCKSCVHYDDYFETCNLYIDEIYLDDGDFDLRYWDIKDVGKDECEYEECEG